LQKSFVKIENVATDYIGEGQASVEDQYFLSRRKSWRTDVKEISGNFIDTNNVD